MDKDELATGDVIVFECPRPQMVRSAVNGEMTVDMPYAGGMWVDDDPRPTAHKSLYDYQQQLAAKRKRKRR
jgi:hypothetical protein